MNIDERILDELLEVADEYAEANGCNAALHSTARHALRSALREPIADAERYRWLRDNWDFRPVFFSGDDAELDAAIDAARAITGDKQPTGSSLYCASGADRTDRGDDGTKREPR